MDWVHFTLEARKTDLKITDVPDSEVFPIEDFSDFKVRLVNGNGVAKIIDFEEYVNKRKIRSEKREETFPLSE